MVSTLILVSLFIPRDPLWWTSAWTNPFNIQQYYWSMLYYFHVITVKLLQYNLYCKKRYINKGDLTWVKFSKGYLYFHSSNEAVYSVRLCSLLYIELGWFVILLQHEHSESDEGQVSVWFTLMRFRKCLCSYHHKRYRVTSISYQEFPFVWTWL